MHFQVLSSFSTATQIILSVTHVTSLHFGFSFTFNGKLFELSRPSKPCLLHDSTLYTRYNTLFLQFMSDTFWLSSIEIRKSRYKVLYLVLIALIVILIMHHSGTIGFQRFPRVMCPGSPEGYITGKG